MDDEILLAALARYAAFTRSRLHEHPMVGFKKVKEMFHWDEVAGALDVDTADAMAKAYGRGQKLPFRFLAQREDIRSPAGRARLGILVKEELITEAEERELLVHLRREDMVWQRREYQGRRANYGATLTPAYRVHSGYRFAEIPEALQSMRARILDFLAASDAVRRFAMTPEARIGCFGWGERQCFNQALLQHYKGVGSPEEHFSQAICMHLDQRDDFAEVVAAVNLGDPGHVFFSSSKPTTRLSLERMRQLDAEGEGILVDLSPRSVYIFFGLARYGLCHGVPSPGEGSGHYDRISVTWRSVREHPAAEAQVPWPLPSPEESEALNVGMWAQHW